RGKRIGPGAVVGLCGVIESTMVVQGSGSQGKPVTLYFMRGAKISQPACSPCLEMDGQQFITVDGGTNGIVESTNNGTNLGLHTPSTGIVANPCSHCEIKNLTVRNIYVHSGSGSEIDQTLVRSIYFDGSNVRIDHNVFHDAGWSVFNDSKNGDHDVRVDNN